MKIPKLRFKEFSDNWEEKSLGEISSNIMYGLNSSATDFDGKNKYIRITDIDENTGSFKPNPLTSPNGELDDNFLVNKNDILFARTGASVGKTYHYNELDGKLYFAGFLIRFNINKANSKFVYYNTLRNRYLNWIKLTSMRTGQPGVNAEEYKSYKFNLPSLEEQEKLGNFLSSIDKKISITEEKLNLFKSYKKGIMQKIFKQEIRFKNENGQDYPDWELVTTKDISNITMGFTPSTKDASMWGGQYKWLSIADLKENGKYISKTSKTITDKGTKNKKILKKGTLIMSFKLTLGSLGIISEDMFTNEAICHFNWINKDLINTEYIYYYLSSINISSFGKQAVKGITLNTESLNSIEIELPCLEEQEKIANFLSSIDNKIENLSAELENLRDFKKGLLQKMFV